MRPILVMRNAGSGGAPLPFSSLLHFDGADGSTTFTDVAGKVWTPHGNAQIDTAQSQFGGASGLFDGSTDYITTPGHADFDFGTGDFTVEWFQRWNSSTGYQNLFDYGYTSSGGIVLQSRGGTNEAKWEIFINASSNTVFESTAASLGTWYHYAICRQSNIMRIYRGGVQTATGGNANTVGPTGANFSVGAKGDGTLGFNGHIDEMRITKGTCLYPNGTTFTPPASPFPDS